MANSLHKITQGCFELLFAAAVFGMAVFVLEWLWRRRCPDRRMLIFSAIFIAMAAWRISVRIFAFRYAIGMAIPAAVLAVYPWCCSAEWRNIKLKRYFRGALMAALAALTVGIVVHVNRVSSPQESFRYLGRMTAALCSAARQWALVNVQSHGVKIAYEMAMTGVNRPSYFISSMPANFPAKLSEMLEVADMVMVTSSLRGDDKVGPVVAKAAQENNIMFSRFEHNKHCAYVLDNRRSWHWGVPRGCAPTVKPPPERSLFFEDFEHPEWINAAESEGLKNFSNAGYPFFRNGKIWFSSQLNLYFHSDHKEANRSRSRFEIVEHIPADAVGGRYGLRIETVEYFTLRLKPIPFRGRCRFAIDFKGPLGGRIRVQAMFVNRQGRWESRDLGSLKIMDGGEMRHGEFETDLSSLPTRNGIGQLVLHVYGDLELDNISVTSI